MNGMAAMTPLRSWEFFQSIVSEEEVWEREETYSGAISIE